MGAAFSKLAKLNRLAPELMTRLNPSNITNAETAAKIVDVWADKSKRRTAIGVVTERTTEGDHVKAMPVFVAILKAVGMAKPTIRATERNKGCCEILDGKGDVLASGDGWTIRGAGLAALWSSILRTAFDALGRSPRKPCTGASPDETEMSEPEGEPF